MQNDIHQFFLQPPVFPLELGNPFIQLFGDGFFSIIYLLVLIPLSVVYM
jgi:hypothetical protein